MALEVFFENEELLIPAVVSGEVRELPSVLEQLDSEINT